MVTLLEIVIEAMVRRRFLPVDLYKSAAQAFLIEDDALRRPCIVQVGASAAASIVQARQDGEFISVEDLRQRSGVTRRSLKRCVCTGA